MRKHRRWCFDCEYKIACMIADGNRPDVCPIGNFDEYDK